jgi:hypothetical protein
MFQRFYETIMNVLEVRGTFSTPPAVIVNTTLETLAGLVEADNQIISRTKLATDAEVSALATVEQALETKNRKAIEPLVDALFFISELKTQIQTDLNTPQKQRDIRWLDLNDIQGMIEQSLDALDPVEVRAWRTGE